MKEDEARAWVRDRFGVSRETLCAAIVAAVVDEAGRQNLIAPSTLPDIWTRHVVDSAQLVSLAEGVSGHWLDIGTGAGFPGLVIAALTERTVTLCEPRRRRAAFLAQVANDLEIDNRVSVATCRVEALAGPRAAIVSARAVASLADLFDAASHLTDRATRWVLPKGRSAREEVAAARKTWHGSFHVEHSLTHPDSLIVVAEDVVRR